MDDLGRLSVDIDTRLTAVWLAALDPDLPLADALDAGGSLLRDVVGASLRAAYGQGYIDALQEDRAGRRAVLLSTHGYAPE